MQQSTFQGNDTTICFDLCLRPKTTLLPRRGEDYSACGRESHSREGEYQGCVAGPTESAKENRDPEELPVVVGECLEAREYRLNNHYHCPPLCESLGTHSRLNYGNHVDMPKPPLAQAPKPPTLTSPSVTQPSNRVRSPVVTSYFPLSLLNVKDKASKGACQSDGLGKSSHCQGSSVVQLWEKLNPSRRARLFSTLLLLMVGVKKINGIRDLYHHSEECVDSGGSSGSGGSSSSGKKQQQNNRSGSSSSQRSGSGSSQRGGTGMGGGRSHSGSSDSSDDNGDDDHNKRPRQQPNKEPKTKMDISDDEDDEETDSADEGEGGTPGNMMVVEVSPQSVQNDNDGSISSSSQGVGGGGGGVKEIGGGAGVGGESVGRRNIGSLGSLPLLGGGGSSGGGGSRFSNVSSGGTVESITLKEGIASGRIEAATLIATTSQVSSPVNMAVGYGLPVLAAPENDSLIAPASSSVPGSELGTPTMDSPSPPPLGGRAATPGTPPSMSPEIAPTAQV